MIYNIQDPLPLRWENEVIEYGDIDYTYDYASDGWWRDPGPCPICNTPHTACVADPIIEPTPPPTPPQELPL